MPRLSDDQRWAAAATIARGQESVQARRLRRRRQWLAASIGMSVLIALVLVAAVTPWGDQLFPPRSSSRRPAGWQLPLGLLGFFGGGFAILRWRVLDQRATAGNWLPLSDPRTVLRARQRRDIDRRIRSGTTPEPAVAAVVFDRAARFTTFPQPVWQLLAMPLSFAALTWSYRGPMGYLVVLWVGWAVVVLGVWWTGSRFHLAAARYVATRDLVAGPVTDPAPER